MANTNTVELGEYFQALTSLDLFRSRGEGFCSREGNLLFTLDFLLGDIDFRGKSMLDIGAGAGVYSCYAALQGAASVVALEPEADGTTFGWADKFEKMAQDLSLRQIEINRCTLQEFPEDSRSFDIILLKDSINHLDESACMELHTSAEARARYRSIFAKIGRMARPEASLLVTDNSRFNFWGALGITNPFCPGIEWEKHQPPQFWSRLLAEAGFREVNLKWGSLKQFRKPGRWFFGNRLVAFFFQSHFRLKMVKK